MGGKKHTIEKKHPGDPKYNLTERNIARKIYKLNSYQHQARKNYFKIDQQIIDLKLKLLKLQKRLHDSYNNFRERELKILALEKKLGGKYQRWHV